MSPHASVPLPTPAQAIGRHLLKRRGKWLDFGLRQTERKVKTKCTNRDQEQSKASEQCTRKLSAAGEESAHSYPESGHQEDGADLRVTFA